MGSLSVGTIGHPVNELTIEILMDLCPPGGATAKARHQQQQHSDLMSRAIAHLNLDKSAMELLENILVMSPFSRWTLAQTIESDFVTGHQSS